MRRLTAVPAVALVAGLVASVVLLAAPAAYASGLPAPTLSRTTAEPGDPFTVSGSGCVPADETDVVFVVAADADPVAPRADGTWSATSRVPTGLTGGQLIVAVDAECHHVAAPDQNYPRVTITVDAAYNWWQTCGPLPGNPGVYGCPGPPPSGHIDPPAPQPTRTTAPRTTAAPSAARTTAPVPPPTTSSAPTSAVAAEVPPTPAPGCRDCGRLTGGGPVAAGERLALSFAGFGPGERVTLVLHSTPVELGTFTADASGTVSASVTVPASLATGPHTLTLTGAATGERVVRFRLAAPPTTSAAATARERSGTSTAVPLGVGAGAALLLGGGPAWAVRRRRAGAIG